MKTTVLLLLLVLAVSPVYAADINPSNDTGCDSVGTGIGAGHEIYELMVSGLESMAEGNTYGATGGWQPYSFSTSCGSIDAETGVVGDVSSCCGSGSVTVTDYAGVTDSIDVRFPGGRWETNPVGELSGCGTKPTASCEVISGATKRNYQYRYDPIVEGHMTCDCPCAEPAPTPPGDYAYRANTQYVIVSTWVCP